jgi:uncharacterized protein YbbC (DUF1343 family)
MNPILDLKDKVLHEGHVGLLCNQTAFDIPSGQYLFEALARRGCLKRLFVPEHGLFAELQDQVPLDSTVVYNDLSLDVEVVSLYGSAEASLSVKAGQLLDLDAIVIDLQDVGCRYFTYTTSVAYLFKVLDEAGFKGAVYVRERPNPAGRQVEGTPLPAEYASFLGWPGLPHRHGLSVGELCQWLQHQTGSRLELQVVPFSPGELSWDSVLAPRSTWEISPSPNMPGPITPLVYSGQCLLEGTNLSEGRGTTRPFEIFGAPYLTWIHRVPPPPATTDALLRPMQFVPVAGKYAAEVCHGYQIHLTGGFYHSLAHSLQTIRFIREHSGADFAWLECAYEFGSRRPAIELLAGDDTLLGFLRGEVDFGFACEALAEGEETWIESVKSVLPESVNLQRITLKPPPRLNKRKKLHQ